MIVIFSMLFFIPTVGTCVPTVPPEEYYPTATLDYLPLTKTTVKMIEETTEMATTVAVAECTTCSIDDIMHDTVSSIEYTDSTSDGCKQIDAKCIVADSCTGGFLYAKNPDGEREIGDSMTTARLTCDKNGKWSSDTIENIEQLRCSFNCGSDGGIIKALF
ncbi:unnamed protein product [Caenorhabditis brenneri]